MSTHVDDDVVLRHRGNVAPWSLGTISWGSSRTILALRMIRDEFRSCHQPPSLIVQAWLCSRDGWWIATYGLSSRVVEFLDFLSNSGSSLEEGVIFSVLLYASIRTCLSILGLVAIAVLHPYVAHATCGHRFLECLYRWTLDTTCCWLPLYALTRYHIFMATWNVSSPACLSTDHRLIKASLAFTCWLRSSLPCPFDVAWDANWGRCVHNFFYCRAIGKDLATILHHFSCCRTVYATLCTLLASVLIAAHHLVRVDRPHFGSLDYSDRRCVRALSNSKLGYERDGPLTPRWERLWFSVGVSLLGVLAYLYDMWNFATELSFAVLAAEMYDRWFKVCWYSFWLSDG